MPHSTSYPPLVHIHRRTPRGNLPRDIRARMWDVTHGQCWYCGTHTNPFIDFCIDHVVPLARGGEDEIENLVPCCSYCNQCKGTQLLHIWRLNFQHADDLNEEPWTDESGVFFFERDPMWEQMRQMEIRTYRRSQGVR